MSGLSFVCNVRCELRCGPPPPQWSFPPLYLRLPVSIRPALLRSLVVLFFCQMSTRLQCFLQYTLISSGVWKSAANPQHLTREPQTEPPACWQGLPPNAVLLMKREHPGQCH